MAITRPWKRFTWKFKCYLFAKLFLSCFFLLKNFVWLMVVIITVQRQCIVIVIAMGMIVTMKKATLKMIRLLWAGSNQLRRQCNRVVPRPVNLWVHCLHLDGSTNKSETSNFLQMTILAKPLRTHRNVPLCHQHSLQSWLNNGPGCRAWKEKWVGADYGPWIIDPL